MHRQRREKPTGTGHMDTPTTVSIINRENGVGRTTHAIDLARNLATDDYDVLLVDLAPEGTATVALGLEDYYADATPTLTLHEVLTDGTMSDRAIDLVVGASEFDIIPAHRRMLGRTVPVLEGDPDARDRFRSILDRLTDYEYIIVDCAPDVDVLTELAHAVDAVLLPRYPNGIDAPAADCLASRLACIEQYSGRVRFLALVSDDVRYNGHGAGLLDLPGVELVGDLFPNS